ncbi:glycosyltransferase family 39 protein [bacterium SCSIO 12741]|nr:glycosyltransferase family 39 protein [bacterium SCSIO 12741]
MKSQKEENQPKDASPKLIHSLLFYAILAIGLGSRLYHYLMGRSLWEDEAHLALNLLDRSFWELTEPLDHLQIAPVLFMLATKIMTSIFGYGEMALRSVPFMSSVLTFPLFYFISLKITGNRRISLLAFFLFAVCLTPGYFASELKPYAVDLAAYLALVYITISDHRLVAKYRNLWLLIAGSIALFMSFTSVIILICIGAYTLTQWIRDKKIDKKQFAVFASWVAVLLFNYLFFIANNPHRKSSEMMNFWDSAFMPINPFSAEFLSFIQIQYKQVFFDLLLNISPLYGFYWVIIAFIVGFVGYAIKSKNRAIYGLVVLPIVIHLILSSFHIYPFYRRLILDLIPPFILIVAIGCYQWANILGKRIHISLFWIVVLISAYQFSIKSYHEFPQWYREFKPSMEYVNNLPDSVSLFVTTPINTVRYYEKTGQLKPKTIIPLNWNLTFQEVESRTLGLPNNSVLLYNLDQLANSEEIHSKLEYSRRIMDQFSFKNYGVTVIKSESENQIRLNHTSFHEYNVISIDEEKLVAIWDGFVETKALKIEPGHYKCTVACKGTSLGNVFSEVAVKLNNSQVQSITCTSDFKLFEKNIEITDSVSVFQFELLNDSSDQVTHEDRNVFINSMSLQKIELEN